MSHANANRKKAGGAALLISKKENRAKSNPRDEENHFIMTEGSTNQEEVRTLNVYASKPELQNTRRKK